MIRVELENAAGVGIYTIPEAARFTKLSPQRIRRWFGAEGRTKTFSPEFVSPDGKKALSFLDLIDVGIAGQLRAKGVQMPVLRRAYVNLQKKFGTTHAFCYRNVWTDGRTVFLREMAESGDDKLVDMEQRQHVLTRVIEPFLEGVEYDSRNNIASRWNIQKGLVIDPSLNFGAPTVAESGHSAYLIASLVKSNNGDIQKVADWYGVSLDSIRRAVSFEESIAA